ncbi:MAG: type II secretion system protein GspE, partial [Gammaproteobacteria bacterium]|nr:type II secretion system protein GspE [Gammaproteobacteria bacterium]
QLQLLGASGPDGIELYRPQGCNHCEYTGYRGRTGIYELIVVDDGLRSMIHDNHSEAAMVEYARRDSPSILENGLNKVRQGVTSLDEVLRVTTES